MSNPFDIPSEITERAIERIQETVLVSWNQPISYSYETTRKMQDIQLSLNDARIALRCPDRDLLFRKLVDGREGIMFVIEREKQNKQIAWQRFSKDNLRPSLVRLEELISSFSKS